MLVASSAGIGRFPGQPSPRRFRGSSSPSHVRDNARFAAELGLLSSASPHSSRRTLKVNPVCAQVKLVRGSTSQSPRRSDRSSHGGRTAAKMSSKFSMPSLNSPSLLPCGSGLLPAPMWKFTPCRSGLSAAAASMARACRILCYGDSLTAGFCAEGLQYQPYAETLSETLNMGGVASEVGVCGLVGHTAETMVAELNSSKAGPDKAGRLGKGLVRILEEDKPIDLVLLMAGTNDLGKGTHPQDIAEDICALHAACHAIGVPTISITPPTGISMQRGWARSNRDQLADMLAIRIGARVGADDGVLAHFDVEELLPRSVSTRYWEPDEIHFSARGSMQLGKLLASWILPAVRDAFCPVRSASPAGNSPTLGAGNGTANSLLESLQSQKNVEEVKVVLASAEEAPQVTQSPPQVTQPPRASSPPVVLRASLPASMPSPSPTRRGRLKSPSRMEERRQAAAARCSSWDSRQLRGPLRSPSPPILLRGSFRCPSPTSSARTVTGISCLESQQQLQIITEDRTQAVPNTPSVELPETSRTLHASSPPVVLRGVEPVSPKASHRLRRPSLDSGDVVEVWSKSSSVWCKGFIRKMEGGIISVEYAPPDGGLSLKKLTADHPEIRLLPRPTKIAPTTKMCGGVVGAKAPLSPTVEIRHAALE